MSEYPHLKLSSQIAEAKQQGAKIKVICIKAIDKTIDSLTNSIRDIQTTVPEKKGFFSEWFGGHKDKDKASELEKQIQQLEKVKVQVEGTLVNSYKEADQLTDQVLTEIQASCCVKRCLQDARRDFREKLRQCCSDIDRELDHLRDSTSDKDLKTSIGKLMSEAYFNDEQKLSNLDSLNTRARLLIVSDTVCAAEPIEKEKPQVEKFSSGVASAAPILEANEPETFSSTAYAIPPEAMVEDHEKEELPEKKSEPVPPPNSLLDPELPEEPEIPAEPVTVKAETESPEPVEIAKIEPEMSHEEDENDEEEDDGNEDNGNDDEVKYDPYVSHEEVETVLEDEDDDVYTPPTVSNLKDAPYKMLAEEEVEEDYSAYMPSKAEEEEEDSSKKPETS